MPLVVHHRGWRTESSPAGPAARDQRACADLERVVDEAIRLQELAQALLHELRDRAPRRGLGRRGASLMSQFVRLRRQLPRSNDASVRRYIEIVDTVLEHHALHLSAELERATEDPRPEPVVETPASDELGNPARWLETVRAELARLQLDGAGS